ncbi:MAG: alpha/beta fold hydrolase [Candidatus Latescibacteria bacterium]|nr:alpha/beta fold hydrolase [Candidatus Latescibacterota bacterium]
MHSRRLSFANTAGQQLGGRLDLPVDGRPLAYALFAHCFTCTKNLKAIGHIARALTRAGLGVLRFDFTGLGESEGDFADTNFSSNADDLVAAAAYLSENFQGPALLVGHSLGGAAVLQAAARIPTARTVATLGAPCQPAHVKKLLGSSQAEIAAQGEAEVLLAGRPFRIKNQFIEDLDQTRMEQTIRQLRRALLVMHAPLDRTVGVDNAAHIFDAALHPKSFVSLDKADHLLSREEDALYAGSVIAAWARKYLDLPPDQAPQTQPPEDVVVARTGAAGLQTDISAGGHALVADEPADVGGTNTGPTPYDLLVSALAACTTMTLRLYADRKGWPLQEVEVKARHRKIHAADCADCETREGRVDVIERIIELEGPLDQAQRQRLLEIADRCPVHRTLHGEVRVETRLQEGSEHTIQE